MWEKQETRFSNLSEIDRITGLVAGVNNLFGKSLALYAMRTGYPYVYHELNAKIKTFLGENLPLVRTALLRYCQNSFEPIGMVVTNSDRKQGSWITTYTKTEDGEKYGDPSIARFILLADEMGMSLNKMNGGTVFRSKLSRSYVSARVLEELIGKEKHTVAELKRKTEINRHTISHSLNYLKKLGFVDYKSVNIDSWGDDQKGYSLAELVDRNKLEHYLTSPENLRQDTLKVREDFYKFNYLIRALKLGLDKITNKKLEEDTKIPLSNASSIISLLCDLGIYRYVEFKGGEIMSSAKILEKGVRVFELAYYPVLRAARELNSRYVRQEYREIIDKLGNQINELFRREKMRYLNEKQLHNKEEAMEKNEIILSIIRNLNMPVFRIKNIKEKLEENGSKINPNTVGNIIYRLIESDKVEKVVQEKLLKDGRIKNLDKGFYRLREN